MTNSPLSIELQTAIEATKVGATLALKYFNKNIEVETKKDSSPVTIADRESEKAIRSFILTKFPNAKFVGEEGGGNKNEKEFWIIDPIDGTRSFSRGLHTWGVLISLYKNNQVVIGVIYSPLLKEVLYAERGKGAYRNGKKIHVSKIDSLKKAYVGYGSLKYFKNKQAIIRLAEESGSTRSPDITYSTSMVACGSMEASVDPYADTWDGAPFKVIIEEAGGKLTGLDGKEWSLNSRGLIASNGLLHNKIVDIVNGIK